MEGINNCFGNSGIPQMVKHIIQQRPTMKTKPKVLAQYPSMEPSACLSPPPTQRPYQSPYPVLEFLFAAIRPECRINLTSLRFGQIPPNLSAPFDQQNPPACASSIPTQKSRFDLSIGTIKMPYLPNKTIISLDKRVNVRLGTSRSSCPVNVRITARAKPNLPAPKPPSSTTTSPRVKDRAKSVAIVMVSVLIRKNHLKIHPFDVCIAHE